MYCQTCGVPIAASMKFCNRCGTSVVTHQNSADIKRTEKRMDDYLDGLFWITAFGVVLTGGGLVLLKKTGLSTEFLIAFVIISATAFLINFGLSLWMVVRLAKATRQAKLFPASAAETGELDQLRPTPELKPAASVTENTTRSFEPIYPKRNPD